MKILTVVPIQQEIDSFLQGCTGQRFNKEDSVTGAL